MNPLNSRGFPSIVGNVFESFESRGNGNVTGLLGRIFGHQSGTGSGELVAGIGPGRHPGSIGAWAYWNPTLHPLEVFRVVLRVEADPPCATGSYTFSPSHNLPFLHSLEATYELRECLRGRRRAHEGSVTFEFLLSGGVSHSKTYELSEVIACLHGKGDKIPVSLAMAPQVLNPDAPELVVLPHSSLKERSDRIRREIEAQRRKQADEQTAKEEAAKKAVDTAKSAAAAAVAAKAAAAKTGAAGGADTKAERAILGGRVALIYGTTTGNTGTVAEMIKAELGASIDHVKTITELVPQDLVVPEVLILGVPTWHIGEMQDDWAAFLPQMDAETLDFKGKKVAIFGLGDAKGYPDTYVDAMQELWEKFEKRGATLHGLWPTAGYDFQKSKAIKDGKFLGLVIDVENQDQLSDERVKAWTNQIKKELSLS